MFRGAIQRTQRWILDSNGSIRYANQYTESGDYLTEHPQGYIDSPLSAYIIPKDLEAGSKVYISDIIQHIVKSSHHTKHRLNTGSGVWDGKKIEVEKPIIEYLIG